MAVEGIVNRVSNLLATQSGTEIETVKDPGQTLDPSDDQVEDGMAVKLNSGTATATHSEALLPAQVANHAANETEAEESYPLDHVVRRIRITFKPLIKEHQNNMSV
jgi:hypothetical protein